MLVRYVEVQGNENAGLQNGGLNSSNEKTMEMVQFSSPATTLHFPVLFPLSHIWLSYEDIHLQLDDFWRRLFSIDLLFYWLHFQELLNSTD